MSRTLVVIGVTLSLVVPAGGCLNHSGGWDGSGFTTEVATDTRPVTLAAEAPPPISGGTLLVSRDGRTAIAADPDRDVVWRVDLVSREAPTSMQDRLVLSETPLRPGDEPGRVVEDATGRIHVVLRRGGAIASFDPAFPQRVTRTPVCSEPRGLEVDDETGTLVVGCTSGELITLSTATGAELRRVDLGNDLRDVVHSRGRLFVSRFRSAELVEVDGEGRLVQSETPDASQDAFGLGLYSPSVAWRTIPLGSGEMLMVHQQGFDETLPDFAYYSLVQRSAVTLFTPDQGPQSLTFQTMGTGVLPVDLAASPDGTRVAVAAAGNGAVLEIERAEIGSGAGNPMAAAGASTLPAAGIIAVAYTPDSQLVFQRRQPAELVFARSGRSIPLTTRSVADTGHEIFHTDSGQGVACASCHPEGREDGRTWLFPVEGPRRTQSIAGGVLDSAPFHWGGDLPDIEAFLGEVFTSRMGGTTLSPERVDAVARFVHAVPAPRSTTSASPASVRRGEELFHASGDCVDCHSGARLSNEHTVDVGTGEPLQVPSLIGIGLRGPWMHDGCAPTLADRFGTCGGDRHGDTADWTSEQIADVVAYLETL